jgi:outer membrane lipoprotein-sorting protein
MKRLPIISLLLLASLAACDAQPASTDTSEMQATIGLTPTVRFLESIAEAPLKVTYHGKRRVVFDYVVDGQSQHMDYTEQVYSDGHGQFLVDPDTVAAPAMTDEQRQFFLLLQRARDSFFYLHRDFRIRDLELFQRNYTINVLPDRTTVAGRSCVAMDIERQSENASVYRIEVDPKTGLVMRWRETTFSGAVVATVEFETFTLSPDLSGVALHGPRFAAEPLSTDGAAAQMGFPVRLPRLLPNGYQLTRAERVDTPSGPWVSVTYGDGAEQIFYLFTHRPSVPTLHGGALPNANIVRVYQIGPWTAAEGEFGNRRCTAVGKVGETALLDMIQSAIE